MSNLQLIQSVAKELRVDENGIGYISIRGAARVCGVDFGGLARLLKGVDFFTTKLGQKLALSGFEGVDFFDGIPDVALAVMIEYYAFEANKKTQEAQMMMRALAAVGVRSLIHQITGWQPEVKKEPTMLDYAKALIAAHETINTLQISVDELIETNAVLEPKADKYDRFLNTDGLTSVEEFAKNVALPGVGRNKMFVILRDAGVIQKNSTLPYQRYISNGCFVVKPENLPSGTTYNRAWLTKAGLEMLMNMFKELSII